MMVVGLMTVGMVRFVTEVGVAVVGVGSATSCVGGVGQGAAA